MRMKVYFPQQFQTFCISLIAVHEQAAAGSSINPQYL